MARPKVTETETFKAALEDAVNAKVEAVLSKLLAHRVEGGVPAQAMPLNGPLLDQGTDTQWARTLALAIAEIADQGTDRKRVAPEILETRNQARLRMETLIIDARALGKEAIYELRHKVYLAERLIDPFWLGPDHVARRTQIKWSGAPNEGMRPVNATATGIFEAFIASIGSTAKVVDEGEARVTAAGLTIIGPPAPVSPSALPAVEASPIVGRTLPGQVKEVRVLGTVAAPARQSA